MEVFGDLREGDTKFPAGMGPLTARENLSAKLAASSGLGAMKV
jgi:hypothetical protein